MIELEFRPLPPDANKGNTLIWTKGTSENSYKHYTDSLDEFLAVYKAPGLTSGRGQNIYNCDYNMLPPKWAVCDFDVRSLHKCNSENKYSYHRSSPCIILKLNEVAGWIPEFYNTSLNLPDNMPKYLKNHIQDTEQLHGIEKNNNVWVTCDGENPADKEFFGPVEYFPINGFPGYFFPYQNQEGYLSPLLAVHFQRPQYGVAINIECKMWARNIIHDKANGIGLVHFELLVD